MMPCPRCRLRMVAREGAGRIVCLSCGTVFRDDPALDITASMALEGATRRTSPVGRHSKHIPLEKHTDGLTHIRGTHDQPWRSEVS